MGWTKLVLAACCFTTCMRHTTFTTIRRLHRCVINKHWILPPYLPLPLSGWINRVTLPHMLACQRVTQPIHRPFRTMSLWPTVWNITTESQHIYLTRTPHHTLPTFGWNSNCTWFQSWLKPMCHLNETTEWLNIQPYVGTLCPASSYPKPIGTTVHLAKSTPKLSIHICTS